MTDTMEVCVRTFVLLHQTKLWLPNKKPLVEIDNMETNHKVNLYNLLLKKDPKRWAELAWVGSLAMLESMDEEQRMAALLIDPLTVDKDPTWYLFCTPLVMRLDDDLVAELSEEDYGSLYHPDPPNLGSPPAGLTGLAVNFGGLKDALAGKLTVLPKLTATGGIGPFPHGPKSPCATCGGVATKLFHAEPYCTKHYMLAKAKVASPPPFDVKLSADQDAYIDLAKKLQAIMHKDQYEKKA